MMGLQLSIPDIVGLIGLFFAGFGLIFAALQIRQNNISRRAEVMLAVVDRYFSNPDERKMYYKIDYHQFTFEPESFRGSEEERSLDGILYNLHVIGRLLRIGAVSVEEIKLLDFEIHRILNNVEVQKYLSWLDEEVKALRISAEPFKDIRYLERKLFQQDALISGKGEGTK